MYKNNIQPELSKTSENNFLRNGSSYNCNHNIGVSSDDDEETSSNNSNSIKNKLNDNYPNSTIRRDNSDINENNSHVSKRRINYNGMPNGHCQKNVSIVDSRTKSLAYENEMEYSYNMPGTSKDTLKTARRKKRSRSWCGVIENGPEIRIYRERLLRTQSHPKPTAIKTFSKLQKLTLASLALVEFMSFCSMSIMAPFFPREAEEKGMSEAMSGFVFSFYALVMFITSPIFGQILPTVGARFLFMSGIFIAGSCHFLFGVLEYIYDYTTFTTFCLIIRGLEALGASAYSTASYVFVVNTFPENIGSVLGILETFVGLGMSAGPAIGGLLYSIGGFALPFYVLGISTVLIMPIIFYLLPSQEEVAIQNKTGSILSLIKVPTVLVTSLVIVIVSNIWAFLDPTLEPHLRKFDLSAEQVGLIFLLFSGLYGIFSPIWGRLADRINRHWCMMVWGLFFCSFGLLLLGPSPLIPYLQSSLTLNLIGLSIIGISVALTLLPTFQGVLLSSIEEGGCGENLATYSIVAGIWSCMYSLGEVIGPLLGGVLLKQYGFPICSTVMALLTFTAAIIALFFFTMKENCKSRDSTISETFTSTSENEGSVVDGNFYEDEPLLGKSSIVFNSTFESKNSKNDYGTSNSFKNSGNNINYTGQVFDDKKYIKPVIAMKGLCKYGKHCNIDKNRNQMYPINCENMNLDNKNIIHNGTELQEISLTSIGEYQLHKNKCINRNNTDFMNYSIDRINFYEQCRQEETNNSMLDRNQITDVRGTINLSLSGACEV